MFTLHFLSNEKTHLSSNVRKAITANIFGAFTGKAVAFQGAEWKEWSTWGTGNRGVHLVCREFKISNKLTTVSLLLIITLHRQF